jgi:hypothetical protein
MYFESLDVIYQAHGWTDQPSESGFDYIIGRLSPRELANLSIELLICDDCSNGHDLVSLQKNEPSSDLLALAKEYKLDLKAIQKAAGKQAIARLKTEQAERQALVDQAASKPGKAKKTAQLTPEKALAQAVAADQKGGGGKAKSGKAKAAGRGALALEKEQTDEAASPPDDSGSADDEQIDEPAAPAESAATVRKTAAASTISAAAAWPFAEDRAT